MQALPLPRPLRQRVDRIRTVESVGETARDAVRFLETSAPRNLYIVEELEDDLVPPEVNVPPASRHEGLD
ncbi:hypothetical protein BHE74_00023745 [Ensete ventricosum]|nr:hypothetical protein BHE74_00023745 [Ensete ventricosum]RZS02343.1 hypothetical protein BHM03_00032387 [Ensete ventricosum]